MLKRSLVVVDASPRSAVRLDLALALAVQHDGEATALYGVVPPLLAIPWAAADGMASAAALLADLDHEQRERALAIFHRAGHAERATWLDGGENPYGVLLRQCFVHDLLVLGQPDHGDGQTGSLPAELLPASILDSGRPTLIVPAAGRFTGTDGPVMVAWKATREAAHAVSAALPWLRCAPQVHIAVQADGDAADPSLAALEHWLRLQGVRAPLQQHPVAAGEVGSRLLSMASDLGAALLVMGCYGHSRAREWVLGGATRTVLHSMTLPVLMAH